MLLVDCSITAVMGINLMPMVTILRVPSGAHGYLQDGRTSTSIIIACLTTSRPPYDTYAADKALVPILKYACPSFSSTLG